MKDINTWNNLEYSSAGFRYTIMLQNSNVYFHHILYCFYMFQHLNKLRTKYMVNVMIPTTFTPHDLELTKYQFNFQVITH
jgi:hypothetical protein